jgi:hypothetical protein
MIIYTLLKHYDNLDKTNVVLTAMIIYIILYIAIPDEYNYIVLITLAIIDYIANSNMGNSSWLQVGVARRRRRSVRPMRTVSPVRTVRPMRPVRPVRPMRTVRPMLTARSIYPKKQMAGTGQKGGKHKKVKFSDNLNQYRYYSPSDIPMQSFFGTMPHQQQPLGFTQPPIFQIPFNVPNQNYVNQGRSGTGNQSGNQSGNGNGTGTQESPQTQKESLVMIDNRHMAVPDDPPQTSGLGLTYDTSADITDDESGISFEDY